MPRRRPTQRSALGLEGGKTSLEGEKSFPGGEHEVARAASEADGVTHIDELRSCDLSDPAIWKRAASGRLHRLHQGVYAVGHTAIPLMGRWRAAVKASGRGAVLSHRAAAAYWGFRGWTGGPIEVTIPRDRVVKRPGIQAHRSAALVRADYVVRGGLAITNPSWTVVALASVLPKHELREAVRHALGEQLVSVVNLLKVLDRVGPVRGTGVLRQILSDGLPERSVLEDVVHHVILSGGFEPPDVNVALWIDGQRVIPDFRWPKQGIVLEADGSRWHDDPISRADDLERQRVLEAKGEIVLRTRWEEAVAHPAKLRERLVSAGAPSREGKLD